MDPAAARVTPLDEQPTAGPTCPERTGLISQRRQHAGVGRFDGASAHVAGPYVNATVLRRERCGRTSASPVDPTPIHMPPEETDL